MPRRQFLTNWQFLFVLFIENGWEKFTGNNLTGMLKIPLRGEFLSFLHFEKLNNGKISNQSKNAGSSWQWQQFDRIKRALFRFQWKTPVTRIGRERCQFPKKLEEDEMKFLQDSV